MSGRHKAYWYLLLTRSRVHSITACAVGLRWCMQRQNWILKDGETLLSPISYLVSCNQVSNKGGKTHTWYWYWTKQPRELLLLSCAHEYEASQRKRQSSVSCQEQPVSWVMMEHGLTCWLLPLVWGGRRGQVNVKGHMMVHYTRVILSARCATEATAPGIWNATGRITTVT